MKERSILLPIFAIVFILFLSACLPQQQGIGLDEVSTIVAETLTALPSSLPTETNTPLPTPTEPAAVTPTILFPTVIPAGSPMPTVAVKPEYACDIINQKPFDDTQFQPGDEFDIHWTIVNIGSRTWEDGTYLEYDSGTEMTSIEKVDLPRLKPGEQYEVVLDATAPSEKDMQVMVWAVIGPGVVKNSKYWMCYPYARIIVGN